MMEMTPQYNTMTFCDIWDSYEKFNSDWTASIYYQRVLDEVDRELVYYLLYSRYGNNPIANLDVNQWKMKVFSIMFQYGPTWQKRLNIQIQISTPPKKKENYHGTYQGNRRGDRRRVRRSVEGIFLL